MKKFLSELNKPVLEEWLTKIMIVFFIALFCWLGGAVLGLLLPESWFIRFISGAGKTVFWIGLIAYILSWVVCLFIPSKRKNLDLLATRKSAKWRSRILIAIFEANPRECAFLARSHPSTLFYS